MSAASRRGGFTLIELLIASAIFVLTATSLITIFVTVTRVQVKESGVAEVNQQAQFLQSQIQYYIQNARIVDMTADVATGTLKLRELSTSTDPTYIYASSSLIYLQQTDSGTPTALTSNKVTVSNLSFTRHYHIASSTAFGNESVSYSFTMTPTSTTLANNYSQTMQVAAQVLTPVPSIVLIQKAMSENANPTASGVSSTYSGANSSGSLLLAVVSNQGSTSSNPTVTDTQGNTWTRIALAKYSSSTSNTVGVYAAANSKNGANTVTAAFAASTSTNASMFLYEYRGANTTLSVDASSSQTQVSTTTPSSGSVNPQGNAELLLGVSAYNSLVDTWTPGLGYAIESSSTVSATLTEDKVVYITAPLDAGWTINNARTTLDLVVAIH